MPTTMSRNSSQAITRTSFNSKASAEPGPGQIISVQMQNFMCHPDFKIEFKSGLNIIIGANAVGKSSIVEALKLALGERIQSNTFRRIRRGCTEASVEISIAFERDDGVLSARKFRRQLRINVNDALSSLFWRSTPPKGEMQQVSLDVYRKELNKLGALSDSSMQILSQHEVAEFAKIPSGERLAQFEKVIWIDRDAGEVAAEQREKNRIESTQQQCSSRNGLASSQNAALVITEKETLYETRKRAQAACKAYADGKIKVNADTAKIDQLRNSVRELDKRRKQLKSAIEIGRMEKLEQVVKFRKFQNSREQYGKTCEQRRTIDKLLTDVALNKEKLKKIDQEKSQHSAACEHYCLQIADSTRQPAAGERNVRAGSVIRAINDPSFNLATFRDLQHPLKTANNSVQALDNIRIELSVLQDGIRAGEREIARIQAQVADVPRMQQHSEALHTLLAEVGQRLDALGDQQQLCRAKNELERAEQAHHEQMRIGMMQTLEVKIENASGSLGRERAQAMRKFLDHTRTLTTRGELQGRVVGPLFSCLFGMRNAAGAPVQPPTDQVVRVFECLIPRSDLYMFLFEHYADLRRAKQTFGGRALSCMTMTDAYMPLNADVKRDFEQLQYRTYKDGQEAPRIAWMDEFLTTEDQSVRNVVCRLFNIHRVPVIRVRSTPVGALLDDVKAVVLRHLRTVDRYVLSIANKEARDREEDLKLYVVKQSQFVRQLTSDSQTIIPKSSLLRYFIAPSPRKYQVEQTLETQEREMREKRTDISEREQQFRLVMNEKSQLVRKIDNLQQLLRDRGSGERLIASTRVEVADKKKRLKSYCDQQAVKEAANVAKLRDALMQHAQIAGDRCQTMCEQLAKFVYADDIAEVSRNIAGDIQIVHDSARFLMYRALRSAQKHLNSTIKQKFIPVDDSELLQKKRTTLVEILLVTESRYKNDLQELARVLHVRGAPAPAPAAVVNGDDDGMVITTDDDTGDDDKRSIAQPSPFASPNVNVGAPGLMSTRRRDSELHGGFQNAVWLKATPVPRLEKLLENGIREFERVLADDRTLSETLEAAQDELKALKAQHKAVEELAKTELELKNMADKKARLEQQKSDCEARLITYEAEFFKDTRRWRAEIDEPLENLSDEFKRLLKLANKKFDGRVRLRTERRKPEDGPVRMVRAADLNDKNDDGIDVHSPGLDIMVSFSSKDTLRSINEHPFSGGEKSLVTMFLIMALQTLHASGCRYRIVDEINQGMDAANETAVMTALMMMAKSSTNTTQYVIITPNLLQDAFRCLDVKDRSTTLYILAPFYVHIRNNKRTLDNADDADSNSENAEPQRRQQQQQPIVPPALRVRMRRPVPEDSEKRYFLESFDSIPQHFARSARKFRFEGMEQYWAEDV